MSFSKPQSRKSLVRLGLPIAFLLTLFIINHSFSNELGWKELNAAMETRQQLFGDHAWQAGTAPSTAFYVGVFELAFPQGYWRLSKDKNVPAPEIHQTIRKYVKKGTPVTFLFFSNPDFQKTARLRFSLKKVKAPYTTLWSQVSTLDFNDSNWSRHYTRISFLSPEIKPDEVNFSVALEPPTSHVEFGTTWFFIAGNDDPTVEKPEVPKKDPAHQNAERMLGGDKGEQRIDRIRRGKFIITVQDQNGKPLPGARVDLKMRRHEFPFGCVLKQSQVTDPQFQQSKLSKAVFSTFNSVLLELDWATIEKSKGSFNIEALDKSIDFLKQHNMNVIAAVWSPGQKPPDWLAASKATAGSAIRGYVSRVVSRLNNKVDGFQFSLDQAGLIAEWVDHSTPRLAGEKLLAWAHLTAPEGKTNLVLRVDNTLKLQQVFDAMARDGSVPNGLSFALPVVSSNVHDVDEWIVLDTLKRLNAGIYISGYLQTNKKTAPIDEQEAATIKQLYTALFSNPLVKGIFFPEPIDAASLVSSNGSPTPLSKELNAMLYGVWGRTQSAESDNTGKLTIKAFFGDYEITAADQKGHTTRAQVHLSADPSMPNEVTLTIKTN